MNANSSVAQAGQPFELAESLKFSADSVRALQFLRDLREVISLRRVPGAPDVYHFADMRESVERLIWGLDCRIISGDAMLNDSQKGHVVDRLRVLARQDAVVAEIGLDALAALINSWSK